MIDAGSNFLSDLNPDGIVFINKNDEVEYVNPAFLNMTGYVSDNFIGLNESELRSRISDLCAQDYAAETFDIKESEDTTVIQLQKPVARSISFTSRTMSDEKGKPSGRVYYFHDMACEQKINGQDRSEYLSVAAHKLRTPLVGILGFSELLVKRDFEPDRQKEIVTTIFRQSNIFKQMLDDFLDLERLDVRKAKGFNIEKGSLEIILNEEVENANQHSEHVKIILEQPEVWPELNFDPDKMKQVIFNLISNAVKFSGEGGSVSCSTVVRSDKGCEEFGICISDQGVGIEPADLNRIGERFFRADKSQSIPGGGLGIAIVKAIMAIHKGRLELTSKKGKGTIATVWLPVAHEPR